MLNCLAAKTQVNADSLSRLWQDTTLSDSIRFKAINTYYKSHTYAEPDSILPLTDYHFNLAQNRGDKAEMSKALNDKAYAYYIKGDTKESMVHLKRSIALLEQSTDTSGLTSVYSNVGYLYIDEGHYQKALKYFYKCLDIFEEKNHTGAQARILQSIGKIFHQIDNNDLAQEHLTRSYNLYLEKEKSKKANIVMSDLAEVFYAQKKYSLAITKGESTIQNLIDSNNKFALADCYFTVAKAYNKIGDTENARIYIDKCLVIDKQIKNKSKIIERLTFDAALYLNKEPLKATERADKILSLIEDDTKHQLKVDLYELLYKCYKAQNKYDQSLTMHEKSVLYSDSLEIQKDRTSIVREAVQKEYESKLKDKEEQSEISKAQLEDKHFKKLTLIGVISALLVTIMGFYSRSKLLSNRKEKEALLAEVERLKSISPTIVSETSQFTLDRDKIESYINRKINETDWKVLNILLDDPVIPNKDIAQKALMSTDGIGSSLRRMYEYFQVKESKYKKISLLMMAIKLSSNKT